MLINLSDIIKDNDGKLELSESFEMPTTDFLGEEFTFSEPCLLEGVILNNTKSLELKGKVTGKMGVHCARCGKPLTVDLEDPVEEILVREDAVFPEDEDVIVYSGSEVELMEAIVNGFLLNVSGKFLCSEDCKGLCSICGANLNEGDCGCNREYIDPRLEKLAEIMKNMSDTE
ncbi:MAG: DUF177 domain-containing protein [Clostridia bacterium]|nr:DUF177 domain-containing protein [Clostridia bacterium]